MVLSPTRIDRSIDDPGLAAGARTPLSPSNARAAAAEVAEIADADVIKAPGRVEVFKVINGQTDVGVVWM